ncbi:Inositol 1,4,5-trisphosphate receptor-interacting protein-like 1, partial [Apaloderma vittatum]
LVMELVSNILGVFHGALSDCFSPVLQPAIGVGSAFEGWSPRDDEDVVYHLLVPLKPPLGHTFHLELGTTGEIPAKDSRVRVELACTCTTGSPGEDTLCFLHNPKKQLRSNKAASFLGTLCTSSYLDVQKTAQWFQSKVKTAWLLLPQSRCYDMKVLPSSRSCKLQLKNASERTLMVELLFGVQQGDSDIFLSSQTPDAAFTPSTTWPQSYAVAEAKFFRHMTSQAPHGRFPLRCLHLCTRILAGTGFSTSALKTIVMHLLITTPLSGWCAKDFLLRLDNIMHYLRQCLETKRLNHFFVGNENVPKEIALPPALQTAEPVNLFQHLAQDQATHDEPLRPLQD